MEEELANYRTSLIEVETQLKESYDKLVVLLSGGALGLSMTFLKDIINLNQIVYPFVLLTAWGAFILSLMAILGALSFGIEAHRKAVLQIDDDTIYDQKAGGRFSWLTKILHRSAAVFLFFGLISMSVFVYINVGDNHAKRETTSETTTGTTTSSTSTTTPAKPKQPAGKALMGSTTSTSKTTKPK